jgi:hypothetical protein
MVPAIMPCQLRAAIHRATWRRSALVLLGWMVVTSTSSAQQPTQKPEDAAAALARRTVVKELSIPDDRLTVVRTAAAEWRDSSLGCPVRGMIYQPVMTSGYKVTIDDGKRQHLVHVAGGRAIICSSKDDPKQSPAPLAAAARQAAAVARAALAKSLGAEVTAVRIVSTRPAGSAAGTCPGAPSRASGAPYLVDLEARGVSYRYYTDDATTVACGTPRP